MGEAASTTALINAPTVVACSLLSVATSVFVGTAFGWGRSKATAAGGNRIGLAVGATLYVSAFSAILLFN